MAKKVMTVLGPVEAKDLGFVDMHEHVMMDGGWVLRERHAGALSSQDDRYTVDDPVTLENIGLICRNFMTNWDALSFEDEDLIQGELEDYKKSGGDTILELSVPGIRHKVPAIKKLSELTGVHIIISTGLYTGDSWPEKYLRMTDEEIRKYMLGEIKYGVEDTGIFPGHIKIAVHRLNKDEERALRAAAKVSCETGLGITVHSSSAVDGDGIRITKILKEEGADLSRAVIAHVGGHFGPSDIRMLALRPELAKLNMDYAKALVDMGINVGMEFYTTFTSNEWMLFAGILTLLRQGYSSQIVLGTDTCAKIMTRRGGGEGYCRLTRFGIPTLRGLGVSDYAIRQMTVENPARILTY